MQPFTVTYHNERDLENPDSDPENEIKSDIDPVPRYWKFLCFSLKNLFSFI